MGLDIAKVHNRLSKYFRSRNGPIAVAVSGGADSLALLHLTLTWAQSRSVHAIIIDHNLRPGSDKDTAIAAQRCKDMGAEVRVLKWKHDGVKTAIQEKAREARYSLIAGTCAQIGSQTVLVGHTEDDQAETIGMRDARGSRARGLAGISETVTAPLWPQTRNLTLFRPLLSVSCGDVRAYCAAHGIAYFDDPANDNPDFTRVAMRKAIRADPAIRPRLLALGREMASVRNRDEEAAREWMRAHMRRIENAGVQFDGAAIADMPADALADMLRLVSGQARRAEPDNMQALADHISCDDFAPRTLGGALVFADNNAIGVARDPGGLLGRRGAPVLRVPVPVKETIVWDGRFEVFTDRPGIYIGPLWPGRAALDDDAKRALKAYPAQMRKTLPGFYRGDTLIAVPALGFQAAPGTFDATDIMQTRFAR